MAAGDRVVLSPGGHVAKLAVPSELEPIGRDLALCNRRSEAPGRAHEHPVVGRPAQSTAGRTGVYERLNEHRHRGVRRIQTVRRHVAQGPCGPQRGPTATHGGDEIGLALESQVALELPGKAGTVAILDEG
jgi:hypothetical protein